MAGRYSGWEHTLHSVLVPALRQHRPDGVLGFSQGAAATALLLSSLEAAQSSPDGDEVLKTCPRPRCADTPVTAEALKYFGTSSLIPNSVVQFMSSSCQSGTPSTDSRLSSPASYPRTRCLRPRCSLCAQPPPACLCTGRLMVW